MVSFDVINFYNNIPHGYGIEAIKFWPEKYFKELSERTNQVYIIENRNLYFKTIISYLMMPTKRRKCEIVTGTEESLVLAIPNTGCFKFTIYEVSPQKYRYSFHCHKRENWKKISR